MKKLKENKTLLGVGIILLLLGVMGMSYAWFSATVNQENVKDQVVSTGTLELTYTDGTEIKLEKARPGATATKTITVKNTGTLETSYNLVWQVLKNEITNDEMVMSATCERLNKAGDKEENCEGLDETPITKNMVLKGVDIPSGYSHRYTVTVTFKEIGAEQNYNQGKDFIGVLGVDEYKAPEPIYCTYDGELSNGAVFEKGPYTYSYKQESSWNTIPLSSNNNDKPVFQNGNLDNYEVTKLASWKTINADGWGVQLTDKTSTDPVTEAPCTYINDKPIVSMTAIFYQSEASSIDLSNFITSEVTDMTAMFYGATALSTLDVSGFDTSHVTSMESMFSFLNLNEIKGLENFDTSNVTNMKNMFNFDRYVTKLDVSNFNTSKVTNMHGMFYDNYKVTALDVSGFNTDNVTDMSYMFFGAGVTTLDLSNFNTSNLSDMSYMFHSCSNLETIYVSDKFVTTNAYGEYVFESSEKLKGGNGTTYDDNHIGIEYARIDTAENPGYFTAKQ